jgi:hypothetical protein
MQDSRGQIFDIKFFWLIFPDILRYQKMTTSGQEFVQEFIKQH